MAFLRFSRDKRGYEHVYLVQPLGRRGKSAPRILYWFRTPPNVKVGREPFDESVRRSLEARYPDLSFNWPKLVATPLPPPDTEKWRERRRERAARRAADAEVEAPSNSESAAGSERAPNVEDPASVVSVGADEPPVQLGNAEESDGEQTPSEDTQSPETGGAAPAVTAAEPEQRHRRRRRRRRRGSGGEGAAPGVSTGPETNALDPRRSGDGE